MPENPNHWGRKATPIGLAVNTMMSFGGFAMLIWLAVHFINGFEKRMDGFESNTRERNVSLYQKISTFTEKQNDVNINFDHRLSKLEYVCCKQ